MNLKDMLGQFAGNLPGRALQISWLKIDANGRDRRQIGDRLSLWTALLQRVVTTTILAQLSIEPDAGAGASTPSHRSGTCRTVTSAENQFSVVWEPKCRGH